MITAVPGTVGAGGDNVGVSNVAVGELAWGALVSLVGEISVACSAAGLARVGFGPPLRKGAFWALHVAGGRLISAEQHNLKS